MSLSVPQREQLESATAYYYQSVAQAKDYLEARGITGRSPVVPASGWW